MFIVRQSLICLLIYLLIYSSVIHLRNIFWDSPIDQALIQALGDTAVNKETPTAYVLVFLRDYDDTVGEYAKWTTRKKSKSL